jgi:hypothetical protein
LKLRQLELPIPQPAKKRDDTGLFHKFAGKMSLSEYAVQTGISRASIKRRILAMVKPLWKSRPYSDWPKPDNIKEVKLINALVKNPKLYDNPQHLQHITDLTETLVIDYLKRTYVLMTGGVE